MITVQVISKATGKPLSGKRVYVAFSGLRGGLEGYTNSNGDVHLNADPFQMDDFGYMKAKWYKELSQITQIAQIKVLY